MNPVVKGNSRNSFFFTLLRGSLGCPDVLLRVLPRTCLIGWDTAGATQKPNRAVTSTRSTRTRQSHIKYIMQRCPSLIILPRGTLLLPSLLRLVFLLSCSLPLYTLISTFCCATSLLEVSWLFYASKLLVVSSYAQA